MNIHNSNVHNGEPGNNPNVHQLISKKKKQQNVEYYSAIKRNKLLIQSYHVK